tara:strand:- start:149 stop:436 length:288 start_codon:yes stop_codon:yes gene_type:complete
MAYGMQIYNASGALTIDYVDRLIRFVQTGTASVSSSGYVDITISGMANNDSWIVLLGSRPGMSAGTSPSNYATKSTNNLRIYGASGTYTYYVFRG